MNFNSIIIGSTGATGRFVLKELIKNNNCSKITSIGRRALGKNLLNSKIKHIVVDSLLDLSSTRKYWINQDVFFNCIGTTKKKAGGPDQFHNIEFGISNEAARMASESKIPHASIISASGANHKKWANKWIHPLFYIKTMGQKEQTIISNFDFQYASIFKPGMLIRMVDDSNIFEKLSKISGVGLNVEVLANAMVADAENVINGTRKLRTKYFLGNNMIINSLKN